MPTNNKEWESWLDATRWVYYKFCTCGGTPKYKYHGPNGLELHVLSTRRLFRVFEKGKPKTGGSLNDMRRVLEGI